MKLLVKKGTTSKPIVVFIQDATKTDGSGLTGLVFNSSGLTAYYWREDTGNAGGTAISLLTMTLGTWTTAGFKEIDATNLPGFYEFCLPDAVLATGSNWAVAMLKGATNMVPVPIEIQLVEFDLGGTEGINLSQSCGNGIYYGSVTGASPTTTTIVDSVLTQATNDHWKNRTIIFVSGVAKYEASTISAFTAASHTLTFGALAIAPAQNDKYIIV